jgi:hypothetical protein
MLLRVRDTVPGDLGCVLRPPDEERGQARTHFGVSCRVDCGVLHPQYCFQYSELHYQLPDPGYPGGFQQIRERHPYAERTVAC